MNSWTLSKNVAGFDAHEFCRSHLRFADDHSQMLAARLLGISEERTVDVISPARDGSLRIIPSSKLPEFVKSGDILPYLERHADLVIDVNDKDRTVSALKLRSWHSDLALQTGGMTYKCGLWMHLGDEIGRIPFDQSAATNGNRDQFHIFRPQALEYPLQDEYEKQIAGWTTMYSRIRKPAAGNNDNMNFDAADVVSLDDLCQLAKTIVTRDYENLPVVTCVQWVHSVVCLALCIPLNRQTMTQLGVEHGWANWAGIDPVDERFEMAKCLPVLPYSREELIAQISSNLGGGISPTKADVDALIEQMAFFNPNLGNLLKQIPAHTLSPMHPLWEARNSRPSTKIHYEYIGTVFHDDYCVQST